MQAAIDRVIRNLFKPTSVFTGESRPEVTRDDAGALAERLLANFTRHLARNTAQRH